MCKKFKLFSMLLELACVGITHSVLTLNIRSTLHIITYTHLRGERERKTE